MNFNIPVKVFLLIRPRLCLICQCSMKSSDEMQSSKAQIQLVLGMVDSFFSICTTRSVLSGFAVAVLLFISLFSKFRIKSVLSPYAVTLNYICSS